MSGIIQAPQISRGTFKNKIIGGDFATNPWQRGTSFTSQTNAYQADRFKWNTGGAMVATITKAADGPTAAQAGILSSSSLKIAITTLDSSIASTDIARIIHAVEGYNFAALAQNPMTLSFWVKAHRTGTYCIGLSNSNADRGFTAEYTISAADTWEFKVIVIPASPAAGTWDYTTGVGLYISWILAAGASYQGSAGSWQAVANLLATSNQVNGVAATSDTFQIALAQLEAGPTQTPFEARSVQEEIMLCRRYYIDTGTTNQFKFIKLNNDAIGGAVCFPTRMRTTPTVHCRNGSTVDGTGGYLVADVAPTVTAGMVTNEGFGQLSKSAAYGSEAAGSFNYIADAEL